MPFFNRKPVYMWPVYFKGNLWSNDWGYNHGILLASAGMTQPMNINNLHFHRLNLAIGTHRYLWIRCCHLKSERGHEWEAGLALWLGQTTALCVGAVTALQNLSTSLGVKTWLFLTGCEHPEPLHFTCSRVCPPRCHILRAYWEKRKKKKDILWLKWKLAIIINLNFNCLHLTWNSAHSPAVPGCIFLNSALHHWCTSKPFEVELPRVALCSSVQTDSWPLPHLAEGDLS